MTLREITNNISSLLDDRIERTDYTIDQIIYTLNYYRSLFLRRDVQRGSRLIPFEQEITDTFDLLDSNSFGRNALKSQSDIPKPVRMKEMDAGGLTYVGERTADVSYPVLQIHRRRFSEYAKYSHSKTFASYLDGKVYLFGGLPDSLSSGDTKDFDIRGIFEKPEEVMELNNPSSDIMSLEYPISSDMLQRITQSLISGEISILTGTQQQQQEVNEQS